MVHQLNTLKKLLVIDLSSMRNLRGQVAKELKKGRVLVNGEQALFLDIIQVLILP